MNRREFVKVSATAAATGLAGWADPFGHSEAGAALSPRVAGPASSVNQPKRPDIVLLLSDQHNPKIAGYAGDSVIRTPNLDQLAQDGVRFENTYCPAPVCVPSRMSLMTSRWPNDQQVWSNRCLLSSNVPTFAHHMTLAGYRTVLCGRMHFEGYDIHHGFEQVLVGDFTTQHDGTPSVFERSRPGPLARRLGNALGQSYVSATTAGPGQTCVQAYDEAVAAAACEQLAGRGDGRPLCMVVGFYGPHCPFIAPRDLYEEYYGKVDLPRIPAGYFEGLHPYLRQWRHKRQIEGLTDEQIRRARAGYYGMVTFLDSQVGRVLNALKVGGCRRDTIVIYASDHGEMAGAHGMWWKSNFYEESARVPMLFSWPGRWPRGRAVEHVTSLVDIGPTLLEIAGAEPLAVSRGRSLLRFLRDGPLELGDWRDETFSEEGGAFDLPPMRMIRSGPWKLCHFHGYDRPQLFHLGDDPGEWQDLGADPRHAKIREQLLCRVLDGWDGGHIQRCVRQRGQDYRLVSRWNRQVRPASPGDWQPPADYDRFDEEE